MIVTCDSGCVQLLRRTGVTLSSEVVESDVNTLIKRFGFAGAESNVITGDRL